MAMAETTRQRFVEMSADQRKRYLDLEKVQRETVYNPKPPSSAVLSMTAPPLVSPTSQYSGPPPPYSYPSSTASSVVGGHNGYISPPESRRADEEKEVQQQQTGSRHSLPSIQEALNRDQPLSIGSLLSQTGIPTSQPPQPASSGWSPTSPVTRAYPESTIRGPPVSLPPSQAPAAYQEKNSRPTFSPQQPPDLTTSRHSNSGIHENRYSSMHAPRTISSPIQPSRPPLSVSQHRHSSPAYESAPRSAPVMNPPHSFSSYPSSYSYSAPLSNVTTSYQAPVTSSHSPWRYSEPEVVRVEEVRRAASRNSPLKQTFGEAVKRHLDSFDLETSLNEIAEGSGRALDFSRHYGSRAHQTQRSGPLPGSMPSLTECDEMIGHQNRVLDSMQRIKEVIVAQQHALAEQRSYEQTFKPPNDLDDDGLGYDKLDGTGGFAGADPKKRRG
ncbi:MAG: hypothetical protein Q9190_005158, partial [Brigantiaea leucoxantha]